MGGQRTKGSWAPWSLTVKRLRERERKGEGSWIILREYSSGASQSIYDGEFDPGSERTLAARFKHASRMAAGATL